jgi:hypothetical protein
MPEQCPHVGERFRSMTVGIVSGRGRARDQFEGGIRLPRGRLLCLREFGRPLNRDDYRQSE